MRGPVLLSAMIGTSTAALTLLQVLHRVHFAAGNATGWQTPRCLLIFLQLALKVFVLDLIVQGWNRSVVVIDLAGWLTIDEGIAVSDAFIGKRLRDPRRRSLGVDFTRADAPE